MQASAGHDRGGKLPREHSILSEAQQSAGSLKMRPLEQAKLVNYCTNVSVTLLYQCYRNIYFLAKKS